MDVTREQLGSPAKEMAHRIARDLTAEAVLTRARLSDRQDVEALHDFRVALRRLRSVLRAYRPQLESRLGNRVTVQLRNLARATGVSRDLEVHLAAVLEAREGLTYRQRSGVGWLTRRLRARKRIADAELHRQVARLFAPMRDRLSTRLARYTLTLDLDTGDVEPSYGAVTRDLILELSQDMQRHLRGVSSLADEMVAHEARLRGKRLRYVLEPVADAIPEGRELLKTLKTVQDQLGILHDSSVFAQEIATAIGEAAVEDGQRLTEGIRSGQTAQVALHRARRRDPRPGLLVIAARLQAESERVFAELQSSGWMGGAGTEFFVRLAHACEHLTAPVGGRPEIERKYLLRSLPPAATEVPVLEIEQGYLPGEHLVERLRRVRSASGESCYRTVKIGSGIARTELEEETSSEVFAVLWPLTEGRRVMKRRARLPAGDLTWEIDEFTDRALVLAEVELPSATVAVELPEWMQPFVEKDVTGDPEYLNAMLAR